MGHVMKAMHSIFTFVLLSSLLGFASDPMAPIEPASYRAPVRLACVGDSITQGNKRGDYPSQLQQMLGDQWQVMNFGHSGRTLLKKGDLPYWKSPRYQEALKSNPDVVIIKLGTNDTKPQNWKFKEEFVADYKQLIGSFKALETKPRIYLCRPCPVVGDGNWGINDANIQVEIQWVNEIAKEMGLGIIDMNAPLVGKPELIPDKVHPNKEGYRVMAVAAYTVLTGKPAPVPALAQ